MRLLYQVLRLLPITCVFVLSAATYRAPMTKPFSMAMGPARNKDMLLRAKLARCLERRDMHDFSQ